MNKKRLPVRLFCYFAGLFIVTIGIAISVKSNLGVSPVSSIPYTMTCVWGIEMGKATIMFHIALIVFQVILMRRSFQLSSLFQFPIGIIFGYFTTFSNSLAAFLPTPENMGIRIFMMLISAAFIALGLFFYVPADIMPMATEGAMLAVNHVTQIRFANCKLGFDIVVVVISLIVCLLMLHRLGSVGIGTVIAAVLVGNIMKVYDKLFGKYRNSLMGIEPL